MIALGCETGSIELLHLTSTGSLSHVTRSTLHPGPVSALSMDATGSRIVSIGAGFLAVTSIAPGLPVLGHTSAPSAITAFACGKEADSSGADGKTLVLLCSGERGKPSHITALSIPNNILSTHHDSSLALNASAMDARTLKVAAEIGSLAITPHGIVAMGLSHHSLLYFSLSRTQVSETIRPTTYPAHAVRGVGQVIAPGEGALVASAGSDGALCLFDGEDLGCRVGLALHNVSSSAVCASSDGSKWVLCYVPLFQSSFWIA